MKRKFSLKPALIVVLSLLIPFGGMVWWHAQSPVVTVSTPVRGPAIQAVYASGTVEPFIMLAIAPRQAGHLTAIYVDEGSQVRKGQLLARLDDTDLRHSVEEASARVKLVQEQYQRTQVLVHEDFLAHAELDRVRSELDAAQAVLKRSRAQRDFLTLVAPDKGRIIRRDAENGQFISAGQAVFSFAYGETLRVTAEVDEEDILQVHVGQKAVLRADAVANQIFDGEVVEITPKGDPVTRSYRVRIRLVNPVALKTGMTVDVNLIVSQRENALLVPSTAVQQGAVWVVSNGRVHRQAVRIGVSAADRVEIIEGLRPDTRIVTTPTEGLREGRAVRVKT